MAQALAPECRTESGPKGKTPWTRRFRRDEDGSMIIFGIFMFVLILWFGGMAVDYMRFETTRARLQGTLDRAVLAAADLDQTLPPAEVVENYFETAGLADFLKDEPIVLEGLNYRIVTASAEAEMPLLFADLPRVFNEPFSPGMSTLTVSGTSTAEERVSNVEVSLILDVSSSMQSNNRFTNLVPAAHDFIDTIMANNGQDTDGLVTMSIVAYSAVVNPGDALASYFSLSDNHNYSNCMLIDDDLFLQPDLPFTPPGGEYDRVAHFDYGAETNKYAHPIQRPWCFPGAENAAIVGSTSTTDLRNMVSGLTSFGNTAIDLGMKWGVALLDPAMRPAFTGMIGTGDVPAIAAGRPLDYDDEDGVLKVAVLMTDGANTTEYDLNDGGGGSVNYKEGMSTVWFWREFPGQALDDVPYHRQSIQYAGVGTATRSDDWFYYPNASGSENYGNNPTPRGYNDYRSETAADAEAPRFMGSGVLYEDDLWHASWQDLFANWVRTQMYKDLFKKAYNHGYISYNTYVATYYALEAVVGGSEADDRLSDICETARDEGITIYAVAFEAPTGGRDALLDCASSPNHFFDVDGTDISEAFSSIASDIRALKLTQ